MSLGEFSKTVVQVRAAQGGDRQALEDLLERYTPWVRQTVALRLGRRRHDCSDLEELVQDTLVDAVKGLVGFEQHGELSFRRWLAQIVLNNVRDAGRRRNRERDRAAGRVTYDASSSGFDAEARDARPSQMAIANELEDRLEQALLALSPTHRDIIVMRERCGMDYAQLATELGFKNADTARALFHRAMGHLRQAMGGDEV